MPRIPAHDRPVIAKFSEDVVEKVFQGNGSRRVVLLLVSSANSGRVQAYTKTLERELLGILRPGEELIVCYDLLPIGCVMDGGTGAAAARCGATCMQRARGT